MTYRWFFGFAIVTFALAAANAVGAMTSPGGVQNAPVIPALVALCILAVRLAIAQKRIDARLDRLERQLLRQSTEPSVS
jgi:hypothetical protein